MIKKYIIIFILSLLNVIKLNAQMSIEEINHRLDTRLYFKLRFDWNTPTLLPDSIQEKFAKALNREIPQAALDSLLPHTPQQIEGVKKHIVRNRQCKEADTICIQEQYEKYIIKTKEDYIEMYSNDIMPNIMILTAANWQIKKAIPVLEKAIGDLQYNQPYVLMALAKLGNDSIKQVLVDKYTLSYVIKNSKLDTINDKMLIYEFYRRDSIWTIREAVEVAMYLKSKEILLNIFDLMYIRGMSETCFSGGYCEYLPYISLFLNDIYLYDYFSAFPNIEILESIGLNYRSAIWQLSSKKRDKKARKELEVLLSTEYRTKIRNQIREWIIENVNFE